MNAAEEATTPNAQDEGDVFGPLTPNSLDGMWLVHQLYSSKLIDHRCLFSIVSKTARSEVLSVGNAAARESPVSVRGPTSATIKPAPQKSKLDLRIFFGPGGERPPFGGKEQGSHSSSSEPTPPSGSDAAEATKLKIRLSPKVTLVVESPPHRHTSDPMNVEPTTKTTAAAETDVSTSTPQRPPPSARSATPPPGFSPVDWSKVSDASRSRSGSAGAGVMSMNAKRSLRSTSSSLSPSLLSLSMNPMKTTPLEVREFSAEYFASDSVPGVSYPLRRPSEDSIAALRMEVRQSPRMSPGMIVLEGSTSVREVEARKRGGTSPLGMSRSVSETSPPPPLPPPPPPTKVQVPVAPEMGATVSMNSVLSVLTPLPTTTTRTEAFSSPKVAPSTSLMSVDSPSQPAQTFKDAEDVPSPSPALPPWPSPTLLSTFSPSPSPPVPAAYAHSDSSSSLSSSPSDLPLTRHGSVVLSIEEEQDAETKPEERNAPLSKANLSSLSRQRHSFFDDHIVDGSTPLGTNEWSPERRERLRARYIDVFGEKVGEGEGGAIGAEEGEEEEDQAQGVRQDEKEEGEVEEGEVEEGELEEGEEEMRLHEVKGTVAAGDEHQEEVEYSDDDEEEEEEEEEEGVTGPSSEAEPPIASVVADDKSTDEYEDEEEEEPSSAQTDEGERGSEEEELQREMEELQEGVDEDEEDVVSAPPSPAQAASSSPSASQSASQAGFRSSSPYASSGVSSITINLNEVDLGRVRFGPPKKVPKGSTFELSQSTTATADCEAVVQSLVMEDSDDGAAASAAAAIWFADEEEDSDDGLAASAAAAAAAIWLADEDEGVLQASAPNSTQAQVVKDRPAEPSSEEEANNLGRSFEGGIPADALDDNENQEDSNLDHTFQNGIPADGHAPESPLAVSPRQQTKSSLPQADGRACLTPITVTADPKTPQRPKSPGYIYVPSRSSSPVKKTSRVMGNGKGKDTGKVKMEGGPVQSIELSDDDEIIFTGRSRRGRPPATRPILTKPPVKLELFNGPGPIETSTPIQQDVPLSPLPLSLVMDTYLNLEPPKTPKRVVDPQPLRDLSPLSDLTPSPKHHMRDLDELPDLTDELDIRSPPPFDPKKHAARVDDDDDTEIRPIKKKRKASAATSVATTAGIGSAMNMKLDPDQSSEATANAPPAKKRLLVVPKKGQSMAVTRVKKKRKAIPEPDEEGEEPPLKKAKLRRSTRSSETSSISRESSKSKEKGKTKGRPVRTSARITPSPAKSGRSSKDIKMENSPAKKISTRRPRGSTKKVAVVWPTCSNPNYDKVSLVMISIHIYL